MQSLSLPSAAVGTGLLPVVVCRLWALPQGLRAGGPHGGGLSCCPWGAGEETALLAPGHSSGADVLRAASCQ